MSNGHRNANRAPARALPQTQRVPGSRIPVAPPSRSLHSVGTEEDLAFSGKKPVKAHPLITSYVRNNTTKIFVMDTNVLMHDPTAVLRFMEHDVYIPMVVLEELDNHKTGMTEIARNVRQVTRLFDELVKGFKGKSSEGIPLSSPASGRLHFQTEAITEKLPDTLPIGKGDNEILRVVIGLGKRYGKRPVTLVTKDVNLRIKAYSLGIPAEDYTSDRVVADTDALPKGLHALPDDFVARTLPALERSKEGTSTCYMLPRTLGKGLVVGDFVYTDLGPRPFAAIVRERREGGGVRVQTVRNHTESKNKVFGITARNREQSFALSLLLDHEIDFVTLLGQAGTGKTLLTLAAGLQQVVGEKLYDEIVVTRATVPLGDDIGYLPGDESDKMNPWMGAIYDNLSVVEVADPKRGASHHQSHDDLRQYVSVKSMSFMRGRTFLRKFLIVDEAQNLTAKQMKALITRAGEGTKVVCLGNLAQIDTPYLTEANSGLTYAVTRFRGWEHFGHLILSNVSRSRLAAHAVAVL